MKLVIQRVEKAQVHIDNKLHSEISAGLLVFLGITHTDSSQEIDWLAKKLVELRIFADENGKMNRSILDTQGELLIVSQFTLYADCRRGRRPDFIASAHPLIANDLYLKFLEKVREFGLDVKEGVFGADMKISLVNDGPVTIVLSQESLVVNG